MSENPIYTLFGEPPADVDLSADSRPGNSAAVILLTIIATAAVVLRLVARHISRLGYQADDYTILLALVFAYATAGMSLAGASYGAGTHVWTTTVPSLVMIYKLLFSYTFIYAAAVSTTKLSILLFYNRIFSQAGALFKISLAFGLFLTVAYPIIVWATMASACKPLSFFWEQFTGVPGSCIDVNSFFLALGIINMIDDVIILAIPIPQILRLQMSARKKGGVSGIMLLGGFVCVASVVRIYELTVFMATPDVLWTMGPVFIWSSVEPSVAIFSACLPCLPPLVRLCREKASRSGSKGASLGYEHHSLGHSLSGWRKEPPRFALASAGRSEDEVQLTSMAVGGGVSHPNRNEMSRTGIMVESSIVQSAHAI